mgnify:CR=1 FL=1
MRTFLFRRSRRSSSETILETRRLYWNSRIAEMIGWKSSILIRRSFE